MGVLIYGNLIRPGGIVQAPFARVQDGRAPFLSNGAAPRQLKRCLVHALFGTAGQATCATHALRRGDQLGDMQAAQRVAGSRVQERPACAGTDFQRNKIFTYAITPWTMAVEMARWRAQ